MAFSTHDIVSDSPTNNFALLNPLYKGFDGPPTLLDGNLKATPSVAQYHTIFSNLSVGSGKWYCEICITGTPNSANYFGIGTAEESNYLTANQTLIGATSNGYSFELSSGSNKRTNNSNTTISTPYIPFSSLDIFQIYMDLDAGKVWFGNNNTYASGGNPNNNTGETFSGLVGNFFIGATLYNGGITSAICNFGQDPTFGGNKTSGSADAPDANGIGAFYYQPPTDALALCTANLPDFTPTVTGDTPQDYFKAAIWTNATTDDDVTVNLPFQADMIWWKQRDQPNGHRLIDSVRGLTSELSPSGDGEEAIIDPATRDYNVTSINSDNFTFNGYVNTGTRGGSMVGWCWKAGGPPDLTSSPTKPFAKDGVQYETLSAANITAGTITPTAMSVNTDAGFSIVSYTGNNVNGATIPHGLNNSPEIIITKNRSISSEWPVAYVPTSISGYLNLPNGFAGVNFNDQFVTAPTSTVFSAGTTGGYVNSNGNNHIAYCWHSVEGYSKFGSYTGNGLADGPFVYCGLRPAFVICKCTSDTTITHTSWAMYDNARDSSNVMNKVLYANKSIQEGYRGDASTAATDIYIDFLSNGFKVRSTKEEINDDGETYIFMAFAEQPFKFSNAR
jgi:hypothetical protein